MWNSELQFQSKFAPETMPPTESRYWKIQYGSHPRDVRVEFRLDNKSKLKLESGNRKIQPVSSLRINRLLPIATNSMHMGFEIEIVKQTCVTPRKPCRLQMDGLTDGQRESSIPLSPITIITTTTTTTPNSVPSHYLNQCLIIVNWTLWNKPPWNFYQNTKLFIHKNASDNVV